MTSELSVQVTGGKGKYYKKNQIELLDNSTDIYTNEELGKVEIINDFLPAPENLVFKEDNVKVTISLSKNSIDFFKKEAKKQHTQYQKMIRNLLDYYTAQHQ